MCDKTIKEIKNCVKNQCKFGYLVLTGNYEYRPNKYYNACFVEVLCVCGTKKYLGFANLKRNTTKSCGCLTKQLMRDAKLGGRTYKDYKYFAPYFLRQIKKGCNRGRKIEFNLTINDLDRLYEKQNGLCYYSGQKLILPDFTLGVRYPESNFNVSVDRINSNLSYCIDNCVLCTVELNVMKMDLPIDKFIDLCSMVTKFSSKI